MSWQSWTVGNDLRRQIRDSDSKGRSAGKQFVRQNRRKDKVWFSGALQELEGQVQNMHLPEPVEKAWREHEPDFSDNPLSKGVESLQKITDPSSWITDYLKGNLPQAALRASVSCAVFHEVKQRGIKRGMRRVAEHYPDYKKVQHVTEYACDIMLPTPLYGPFFLFLMGKAREWAVGSILSAVGLKGDD